MKRGIWVCASLVFVYLAAISVHCASAAMNFFDQKLSVDGYIQNQSSYRTTANNRGLVSSENLLQVEMSAEITDNFALSGIYRGMYDMIYDLRHDSERWDRLYAGSRDDLCLDSKLREFYADVSLGDLDLRIGKQQVVWGESDGLRLMDIINPLDMRRQYITRSWEDIRRPVWLLNAKYSIDPMSNSYFQFILNPGNLKRDQLYWDTTLDNSHDSPWTISNPPLLEDLQIDDLVNLVGPGPFPPGGLFTSSSGLSVPYLRRMGVVTLGSDHHTKFSFGNTEVGVRVAGEVGGFFCTLNYWDGFAKLPIIKYKGGGLLNGGAPLPGVPIPLDGYLDGTLAPAIPGYKGPYPGLEKQFPIRLKYYYPRENVLGFTFNKAVGLWVFRGEFATYLDKRFNKVASGDKWAPAIWVLNNAFASGDFVDKKVQQASMLGFDYKPWIKWLNPEKMFFISGQLFHYHIFNYDDELKIGPYMQQARKDSFALSLKVNTGYDMERICPDVLVVYDPTNTGWYIKPLVEFKYGDHWRPEIGALLFSGDQYELPFGEMDHKDEVYLRIKYQF